MLIEIAVYGDGFYKLSHMLMRKNVSNDSPIIAFEKSLRNMQRIHGCTKHPLYSDALCNPPLAIAVQSVLSFLNFLNGVQQCAC